VSMKTITRRIIAFSILHLIVLLTSIVVFFGLGMDRFDTGILKETPLESVTGFLSDILGFPGMYLWSACASKNLSNIIEWLVFIGNSILYSIGHNHANVEPTTAA